MTQNERNMLFEQMVNGKLLSIIHRSSIAEKMMVCVSTICALMREFESDWVSLSPEKMSQEDQQALIAELGTYCQVPVKTLIGYWRRMMRAGRTHSDWGLFNVITKFLFDYRQSISAEWLLATYMFTAFTAVKASKPGFGMPFSFVIDKKNNLRLEYRYRLSSNRRWRVAISRPLFRFDKVNLPGIKKVFTPKGLFVMKVDA